MSRQGPSLRSTARGAVAKLSGRSIYFGRDVDDPHTVELFGRVKARWIAAGRRLTEHVLDALHEGRADRGGRPREQDELTVTVLADRFLAHLEERKPAAWIKNNLSRAKRPLHPLQQLSEGATFQRASPCSNP